MTKGTQNLNYPPGATKYYTNCRGVNYVPIMYSQWEKSGYMPRYSIDSLFRIFTILYGTDPLSVIGSETYGFEGSSCFLGANKTSQWWYYDSSDNEKSVQLLRSIGINALRVFLDIYVWEKKGQQFINDVKDFLKICDKYKIRVQFVLWDGIYVPGGSDITEPGSVSSAYLTSLYDASFTAAGFSRKMNYFKDPVDYGLANNWLRQPLGYQISSAPAAENFWSTSAQYYITDLCTNLSSHQSLWSFDLANESDYDKEPHKFDILMTSSSHLISSLLSSIGIGITFGNGDSFRFYNDTLVGGINNGQNFNDIYYGGGRKSALLDFSSLYNFASIHPYACNTRMVMQRYVDEAVSASQAIGKPSMYSEGQYPPYRTIIKYLNMEKNYGGMLWDGVIDYGLTHKPFANYGGFFHPDGQVRVKEDIDQVVAWTLSHNWLKKSQLNLTTTEKKLSTDNGLDGGYTSATVPFHANYNPSLHVSTTEIKWNFIAGAVYNATGLNPLASIFKLVVQKEFSPKNYVPIYDEQPFSLLITDYDSKKTEIQDYVRMCRNYKTEFRAFSSILYEDYGILSSTTPVNPGLSAGPIYQRLNQEAVKKILILDKCSTTVLQVFKPLPQSRLIGSQYDYLPASSLRLAASAHLFQYLRGLNVDQGFGDGSSIIAWADLKSVTSVTVTPSWTYGTGYYMTPGNKNSGVDWWKYDIWFNTAFDYVNQYLDVLEEAAKTDDRYRLY